MLDTVTDSVGSMSIYDALRVEARAFGLEVFVNPHGVVLHGSRTARCFGEPFGDEIRCALALGWLRGVRARADAIRLVSKTTAERGSMT